MLVVKRQHSDDSVRVCVCASVCVCLVIHEITRKKQLWCSCENPSFCDVSYYVFEMC